MEKNVWRFETPNSFCKLLVLTRAKVYEKTFIGGLTLLIMYMIRCI